MAYHIKKPSSLNNGQSIYYTGSVKGFARWSDDYSKRKVYTNNPTYLTKNDDGKNGGWTGFTVVSE
tara:strand:+ start:338 stop:535 length:198 start_codon:yes stop_codon:yes gene_type:complete